MINRMKVILGKVKSMRFRECTFNVMVYSWICFFIGSSSTYFTIEMSRSAGILDFKVKGVQLIYDVLMKYIPIILLLLSLAFTLVWLLGLVARFGFAIDAYLSPHKNALSTDKEDVEHEHGYPCQHDFNDGWDAQLRVLIDKGVFVNIDKYTVSLKYDDVIYSVWIGNKFYAYGYLWEKTIGEKKTRIPKCMYFCPAESTMKKLCQYVDAIYAVLYQKYYGDGPSDKGNVVMLPVLHRQHGDKHEGDDNA
ncbi:hypothetical protein PHA77_18530 (plasmid) [Edwardsiella tarda]|uniref:hypothetical protein n=1 Tax=Edwardsiella tarda TaxID=636 RepID=UPI0024450ED8|nr:hypothetical protein [Edwardsiella tarda]WGE31021.1 hypothetical protein PHA77_18530 [Edwardsiella tarda]